MNTAHRHRRAAPKMSPATFVQDSSARCCRKTIDLNVAVDVADFATKFRTACAMLGNDVPPRPRRPLPGQPKVIEHVDKR